MRTIRTDTSNSPMLGGSVEAGGIAFTHDDTMLVVEGTAAQLVVWARQLYQRALVFDGREGVADLIDQLNPRTYEPEALNGEVEDRYVVDLYGISVGVVPTGGGLDLDVNLDDVAPEHLPVTVTVDHMHVGDFRDDEADDDAAATLIDLDEVVRELRKMRIQAVVEQTGGNCATIYAGTPVYDPAEQYERYPVAAGPGHFLGPGWTNPRSFPEEFTLGRNDDGVTDAYNPPDDATVADMARMMAHVLAGREPIVDGVVPQLPDSERAALALPANGPVIVEVPLVLAAPEPVSAPAPVLDAAEGRKATLAALNTMWIDEGRPAHAFNHFTPNNDELDGYCRLCGNTRDGVAEHIPADTAPVDTRSLAEKLGADEVECALRTLAELAANGFADPDQVLSGRQKDCAAEVAALVAAEEDGDT